MSKQMTKLMPWVGGKAQLMWAIQMLLPTHYKTLVDVFGGSGIITLNTAVPSGCLQIYNDLNHDLYNLLFCAKERPLELVRELGFLPINAHDEFDVLQRQLRGIYDGVHGAAVGSDGDPIAAAPGRGRAAAAFGAWPSG